VYSLLGLIAILLVSAGAFVPRFFNIPPGQEQISIWLVILLGISIGVSIQCHPGGHLARHAALRPG
jgi:hypothetical protein